MEAVAAEWMLEFACSCLCRHFAEQSGAEFWRWKDVAQALINGFSQIPPQQKKTVYLCQLLIRIAQGKNLVLQFENDKKISPLESALSFWTLLEKEEIKLAKLHEDIRRLIQIQIVAVHMENRYFKEAAEVLERLFTDSESDKPLRVKLATVIKTKDPHVPLLQSFSYSLLISKVKSYTELFMKENETNFLIQEATKHVASKGLEATTLQNRPVKVNENDKSDLKTKKRLLKEEQYITSQSSGDTKNPRRCSGQEPEKNRVLQNNLVGKELKKLTDWKNKSYCKMQKVKMFVHFPGITSSKPNNTDNVTLISLSNTHNVEKNEVSLACSRRKQRWTYKEDLELKLGVKEFGVGKWAQILVHGNFSNRTSVMLKDRWRTLNKMKQR